MICHNVDQGSYEWLLVRSGKLTGTRLKKLMGSDPLAVLDKIITEQEGVIEMDGYQSASMQWGEDYEPLALTEYEKIKQVSVDRVGFIQSSTNPLIGLSPDGLVGDNGAVEVKCPDTETHVRYIRQGKLPSDYKYQAAMYFIVHEKLEWLDFVSFDPRLIRKPMFIHRSTRDDMKLLIEESEKKIESYLNKLESLKTEIFF
jgi:predicted phage-related endonuclease